MSGTWGQTRCSVFLNCLTVTSHSIARTRRLGTRLGKFNVLRATDPNDSFVLSETNTSRLRGSPERTEYFLNKVNLTKYLHLPNYYLLYQVVEEILLQRVASSHLQIIHCLFPRFLTAFGALERPLTATYLSALWNLQESMVPMPNARLIPLK